MQKLRWLLAIVMVGGLMMVVVAPAPATHSPYHPDCSDNRDNDGDGKVDYPADPGCTGYHDEDETDPAPPPPPPTGKKLKCNSGRGNGSEINPATGKDCDPGNSGAKNKGGD